MVVQLENGFQRKYFSNFQMCRFSGNQIFTFTSTITIKSIVQENFHCNGLHSSLSLRRGITVTNEV